MTPLSPLASRKFGSLFAAIESLRRFDASAWALVAANLVPLIGVLFLHWNAGFLVILYWAENLVIGFYNVLKMIFAPVERPALHLGKLFIVPFFAIHYGGFCGGHGLFVLALTATGGMQSVGLILKDGLTWWGPLVFIQMLWIVVSHLIRTGGLALALPVGALMLSHGVSFVQHYVLGSERRKAFDWMAVPSQLGSDHTKNRKDARKVLDLMTAPYRRIMILHVAIIAGALPVMLLGSPVPLLVVLVTIKIFMDLWLHAKSHAKPAEAAEAADPG